MKMINEDVTCVCVLKTIRVLSVSSKTTELQGNSSLLVTHTQFVSCGKRCRGCVCVCVCVHACVCARASARLSTFENFYLIRSMWPVCSPTGTVVSDLALSFKGNLGSTSGGISQYSISDSIPW